MKKQILRLWPMTVAIAVALLLSSYGWSIMEVSAAETLQGIGVEKGAKVFTLPEGTDHSFLPCSPELHWIDGKWNIYYSAVSSVSEDGDDDDRRLFHIDNIQIGPVEQKTTNEDPFTINTSFNMDTLQAGKTLETEVEVTNNSGKNSPVLAIAALYNERNQLINVSYISKVIGNRQQETLHAGFMLPSKIQGHKVKVFVWEGEDIFTTSMKPLSNVSILDDTQPLMYGVVADKYSIAGGRHCLVIISTKGMLDYYSEYRISQGIGDFIFYSVNEHDEVNNAELCDKMVPMNGTAKIEQVTSNYIKVSGKIYIFADNVVVYYNKDFDPGEDFEVMVVEDLDKDMEVMLFLNDYEEVIGVGVSSK